MQCYLSVDQTTSMFQHQQQQDNKDSNVLPRRKINYLGDTLEEIVDVTADSPHSSKLLLGAEPFLYLNKTRIKYKNSHVLT
jgi:hypothetical protein